MTGPIEALPLGIQDSWVTQLIPYTFVPTLVYRPQPPGSIV